MEKIKLYIADDHQLIVDGIQSLLQDQEQFLFCGSSNNGMDAEQDILSLKPQIALLDIRMPGKDGIRVIQSLAEKKSNCKVIVLSMYEEVRYINDAKTFGAWGYLLKNTGKRDFIASITKVHLGEKVFHKVENKSVTQEVFFTPREKDVIRLLKKGLQNQQIADALNLGLQTILSHRKNIREKTGTNNATGLMGYLDENGIVLD